MTDIRPLRRALVSVYDKTGLDELARDLHAAGVSIVSTGSTAKTIEAAGVPVTPVEELTGFPECLDGRVKTLHPRVHAGILADLRLESHVAQLAELDIEPFDLVVVNLYPFIDTVMSGATPDECVEQIDIGGPSMVRAAAKNHPSVAVVVSPDRYDQVRDAIAAGGFTLDQRKKLAAQAFAHTAAYDVAVASWFGSGYTVPEDGSVFPDFVGATWDKSAVLRYGENPHQPAALYRNWRGGLATAEQLHGKEMSYNNYVDTDAARRAAHDFDAPAVAIIKHANPCGIAIGDDIAAAHARAHACDPVSAYGGVIAANRPVSVAMAEQVAEVFTEVIVAPEYEPGALEVLQAKKNIRILRLPPGGHPEPIEMRAISGGVLIQQVDRVDAVLDGGGGDDPVVLDAGGRRTGRREDPRRPGLRLDGGARGQVQRDPAGQRRRLGRRRHGPGEPGRLLPPGGRACGCRAGCRAPSPRQTRSSRSPTGSRSSSPRACGRSSSRAARSATTPWWRPPRRPGSRCTSPGRGTSSTKGGAGRRSPSRRRGCGRR